MSLFANKWDFMLGAMLGSMLILRYIYVRYKTYRYVDSMLGFQCKYNIRIFTLKKLDILT